MKPSSNVCVLKRWTVAAYAAFLACSGGAAAQTAAASFGGGGPPAAGWVATWASAPIAPGETTIDSLFGGNRSRVFSNETVRHVAHTSVGGRRVRVRVSNVFGKSALRVGTTYVAMSAGGAAIYPHTSRRVTFSGQSALLIPAGAVALSDAVDLEVPGGAELAVSIHLPGPTEQATFHEFTLQTSYIASGDVASATDLPGATPTPATYYLTAVEVLPHEPVGTLVAFGDSITLGGGSSADQNRTWPERLSARLNPNPLRPRLSVINQGIGCGRLLWDFCGPGGAARFDRDVLAASGVTRVIVALGLNDIMIPAVMPMFGKPDFAAQAVSAHDIIVGLHQLSLRARNAGLRVFGATLTPFGSSAVPGLFTPENEAKRQAVNRWIRTSGAFDGVIDFEAAVRDPSNPARLLPAYDADGVHLTDAGYQAMANAVNLPMLLW
jgi:lysophospholipase L1-like esterase